MLWVAWLALAVPATAQKPLAIRNVSVLVPTGNQMLPGQTVVVRDEHIVEVAPVGDAKIPRRARVIDGEGLFLIPGLNDLHVHIKRSRDDVEKLFALFLQHGVTTVLNLDGGTQVLKLRDEVVAGTLLGPTIYTSGPILRGGAELSREEGARLAEEHIDAGYDMIKVYNGVGADAYDGIVDVARAQDVPVVGHAVRSVGLLAGIERGQHIAHMEEVVYGYFTWSGRERGELPEDPAARLGALLDRSEIGRIAERVARANVFVIPNLIAYHQIESQLLDLEEMLGRTEVAAMPASMVRSWQADRNSYLKRRDPARFLASVQQTFPFLQELTAAFADRGVALVTGTDVGIPAVLAGVSLHEELEELVAAGLTPAQALAASTSAAAAFLGRNDIGTVSVGQVADLVLLGGDPLRDIRNTRKIERVILRGKLLD